MNTGWDEQYDVIVIGSGAPGLTAALTAKILGLSVLVIEKTNYVGGVTALSEGELWIPNNHLLEKAGISDSFEKARAYLDGCYQIPEKMRDVFLYEAPKMIRFLEQNTDNIRFTTAPYGGDTYSEKLGAIPRGRTLVTKSMHTKKIKRFFGRKEIQYKSCTPFNEVQGAINLPFKKEDVLINESLITPLLSTFYQTGGEISFQTFVKQFIWQGDQVVGIKVIKDGIKLKIKARKGVVIATESIIRNEEKYDLKNLKQEEYAKLEIDYSFREKRAIYSTKIEAPISFNLIKYIPNSIVVNHMGEKCTKGPGSHNKFIKGMFTNKEMYWIMDQKGKNQLSVLLKKMRKKIDEVVFLKGNSLSQLAHKMKIGPNKLMATIWGYNSFVRSCNNPDYMSVDCRLGNNYKEKALLSKPPFYAIQLDTRVIGWIDEFMIDERARVLQKEGIPIQGLYATRSFISMNAEENEPAPGTALGMAMTFGYIAGKQLVLT